MKTLLSLYSPRLPIYFVYMLQQVEYSPKKFLDWLELLFKSNKPVSSVVYRKKLVKTNKAKLLIVASCIFLILWFSLVYLFLGDANFNLIALNLTVIVMTSPFALTIFLAILSFFASVLIIRPVNNKAISRSAEVFNKSNATKIAVLGSYGKTSMKELLTIVLSEKFKVASTPGNMNTSVSHARFASRLTGKEEVIVLEFGEGEPGDIARMTKTFAPDIAVITGLAPNHLDYYPNIKSIAKDLLTVTNDPNTKVYASDESELLKPYISKSLSKSIEIFGSDSVLGWKISNTVVSVKGTTFKMSKGNKESKISSKLVGRHHVAPLAFVAALASSLGFTTAEIANGIDKVHPHEHRMQARNMHGAWIIDDTYNGNIEGLKAGLNLLSELDFKRKWYVTPGLVDQGNETENVHTRLGAAIAKAKPDIVVLMQNSVRAIIEKSMISNGFEGELRIETDPLKFYTDLEHHIVSGDLVVMQNDWTDNYN